MIDELRLAAAHVVVDPADLGDERPHLSTHDAHHLARVLRLRAGEIVTATDGAGRWRPCRWSGDPMELIADGAVQSIERPQPPITVGFAPVKGDRPEWTVQKLTELGVDRIVILRTARSIVRVDEAKVTRFAKVAREAVMQSRQCFLPEIIGPVGLASVPDAALAHPGGGPLTPECQTVLVGPEGGWDDAELAEKRPHVRLGATVLRAETAAVAAAVMLGWCRDGAIPTERGRIT